MKHSTKLIAAAVAAALGTTAYANPAADWTNGNINTSNIYYAGGGSAEPQAVFVALSALLTPGTIDVFSDAGAAAAHPQSGNYLIVSGTLTNASSDGSVPAGTNIGFLYKYNGGSFPNGGQAQLPASTGSNLVYPTPAQLATATAAGTHACNNGKTVLACSNPDTSTIPTSVNPDFFFASGNTANSIPDWGVTDEDIPLFNFLWNLNGVNVQNITGLPTAANGWVNMFGVAVTNALYAHKKMWSKAEVAAVLEGGHGGHGVTSWTQLTDDSGVALPASLGAVIIIDRGSGSGTKAAGTEYFCRYPSDSFKLSGTCNPHSVTANTTSGVNGGYTGALNTAGTALQDIKEASNATEVDDLTTAAAAGRGALAILGLEFPPVEYQASNATGTNAYAFAAINGVWPDTQTGTTDNINTATKPATSKYTNVVNGSYDLAYQTSIQNHATLVGVQLDIVAGLQSESLSGAGTGKGFPTAAPGVMLDPATTGTGDAGNLTWSRGGIAVAAPTYVGAVTAPVGDPL